MVGPGRDILVIYIRERTSGLSVSIHFRLRSVGSFSRDLSDFPPQNPNIVPFGKAAPALASTDEGMGQSPRSERWPVIEPVSRPGDVL